MSSITIKDIAKICDVGVTTVSRAINNHPDINAETKQKIMDVIKEYNYVPNNSARNLKRTDTKTIAILVKAVDNPFFSKMIRVFEKNIHGRGYNFFLQHVDEQQDEISVALQLEKEKKLKGIVFLGGRFLNNEEKLKMLSVPYVLSTVGGIKIPDRSVGTCISVDDRKESEKIVDYLCELGHKDIAFLAAMADDEAVGKLRVQGYRDSLEKHGLTFDKDMVFYMDEKFEPYSMKTGYEMAKQLMGSGKKFTAIVCVSDMVAIGASKALFESGKKIPQDCSVAGFDGMSQSYYYEPSITTIKQPLDEMAEASIEAIFTMMETNKSIESMLFKGELLKRKSTDRI